MKNQRGDSVLGYIYLLFWLSVCIMWCVNIGKLIFLDESVKMTILRAIGIFVAPMGAILGFM